MSTRNFFLNKLWENQACDLESTNVYASSLSLGDLPCSSHRSPELFALRLPTRLCLCSSAADRTLVLDCNTQKHIFLRKNLIVAIAHTCTSGIALIRPTGRSSSHNTRKHILQRINLTVAIANTCTSGTALSRQRPRLDQVAEDAQRTKHIKFKTCDVPKVATRSLAHARRHLSRGEVTSGRGRPRLGAARLPFATFFVMCFCSCTNFAFSVPSFLALDISKAFLFS